MEDLPPVDSVGKLIACQLTVHYCGALYLEFQVFQSGASSYSTIIIISLTF